MLKKLSKINYLSNANLLLIFYLIVHLLFIFYIGNGQTGDDDYHYYAIAERFSYINNVNLNALINEVDQENVEIYDVGRLKISFSNGYQYPLWTYLFFLLKRATSLDFVYVNFIFYAVQMIFFSCGLNNLLKKINNDNFKLKNLILLSFVGLVSVPTILVSIPMNMCVALNFYAYSLLIHNKRTAFICSLISIFIHPASLIIIFYLLMILISSSYINRKILYKEIFLYALLIIIWAFFYLKVIGSIGVNIENKILLDFNKFKYFFISFNYFFTIYSLLYFIVLLKYKLIESELNLLLSTLISTLIIIVCYLITSNQFNHHPLLNPFGRIFYFLPYIVHVLLCLIILKYFKFHKKLSLLIITILLLYNAINSYKIASDQLINRDYGRLSELRLDIEKLFNPKDLNAFVFDNHEIGLILASSGFLDSKFFWSKVSKPRVIDNVDNYFFFYKPDTALENLCMKDKLILIDKSIVYHYVKCQ